MPLVISPRFFYQLACLFSRFSVRSSFIVVANANASVNGNRLLIFTCVFLAICIKITISYALMLYSDIQSDIYANCQRSTMWECRWLNHYYLLAILYLKLNANLLQWMDESSLYRMNNICLSVCLFVWIQKKSLIGLYFNGRWSEYELSNPMFWQSQKCDIHVQM